jgi:Bacterial DNA-binding protein
VLEQGSTNLPLVIAASRRVSDCQRRVVGVERDPTPPASQATKERKGINPFTKEPTVFKAKPARKIIRARPVKAAKDAV